MAKKEQEPKIVLERKYNVPLRREFQKAASWRRTEKAVKALRQFIARHMKSDDVSIGKYANRLLWKNGIKNPPHHVKVIAVKDEDGNVKVELADLPDRAKREEQKQKEIEKKKEEEKKEEEAKGEKEAKKEEKAEEAREEKEEKAKEIEKKELKELKKELPKQHTPKHPVMPEQVEQRHTAPKGM